MYIPLKVTTDYTLLESLIKVKNLINFCLYKNITCCGICDKNLFSSIEFYKLAKKNNIKPIIGLDLEINNNQVYLYAKNYDGYKDLLKVNEIILERNLTILELKNISSNLVVVIPYKSKIIYSDLDFIKDLYLSYETEEELKNSLIITDNVIYLNDIKVFNKEDSKYLQYLDKIKETEQDRIYNHNYFDNNLTKFDIDKIIKFIKLIDIEIPFNKRYIPKYNKNIDSLKYLTSLCKKGLVKRLNNNIPKNYLERLKYELDIIQKMDFVDYFLIVYDYVLYAKKHNILVGPGRGSAAGSLVSYVIGITDIDPLKYNLLFERFLNEQRVTMPDIDIDFDNTKREKVIDYVKEKYGKENVSGGLTYTTYKTRLVLRDIGKILKIDDKLLNQFIKVLDRDSSLKINLKKDDVRKYLNSYPELKKLYEISFHLEGLKKNISTHAAGIVISNIPLNEIIPMYKKEDIYLCGVPMEYLEDLGLLKMDFLALKNLSIISNIISQIPNFNLNKIPLDDKKVYELFSNADTSGIFQFETPSFKKMLTKYKPRNFLELVASIALVRPGPIKELESYIRRKDHKEKVSYYHDNLKNILEETYGVIVYQEQVISILVKMANFTYAEADNIRRAMSKKNIELIKEAEDKFIKNAMKNGYNKETVIDIFNHIKLFASYGFNKAHSVSYALVSYQMAYLKVHYHSLFIFELLNDSLGSFEKTKEYLNELKNDNKEIYKVSINKSYLNFKLINNKVYLPFKLIKNLRFDLINNILEEREKGLFKDIYDFFKRTCSFISKNEYLMLINAGVLNELGINIKTLIFNLDVLINYGNLYKDLGNDTLIPEIKKEQEYDEDTLRVIELNSYGFYITNHPASKYNDKNIMKLANLKKYLFKNVICYILVENIIKIKTKKNEDMAFIDGSDETKLCSFIIFPKQFYLLKDIKRNDLIKVYGYVSKRFDKYNIIVNNILKE